MSKQFLRLFALLALTFTAGLAPAQAPGGAPPGQPGAQMEELAMKAASLVPFFLSGKLQNSKPYNDFCSNEMKKILPAAQLDQISQQIRSQVGKMLRVGDARAEPFQGLESRVIRIDFENASLDFRAVFDAQRKIGIIMITPVEIQFMDAPSSDELAKDAKGVVDLIMKQDMEAVFKRLDANAQKELPVSKFKEVYTQLTALAGPFKKRLGVKMGKKNNLEVRRVICAFQNGILNADIVYNASKQIAGIAITPSTEQVQQSSAAPSGDFDEKEVTVGSGEWALRATLTLPQGTGPFPAVVLVHGSGPQDRDETIGPNKPFRDLAWGLADKKIAVLRYEKRTKEHAMECVASEKPLTVKEETIDDAISAVAMLRGMKEIDGKKIVVAGHSLGGMLIPRIAAADPAIGGFVILAGTTRRLEDVILQQVSYINSLNTTGARDQMANLDRIRQQVRRIKALKPADASSEALILGASAKYWLDLKSYRPAEAAKAIKQPLLVLQGERDYQVTMDDFKGWQKALAARTDVTFKSYPDLNHLFMQGLGKSTPAEYELPGAVAPVVIDDIATWIKNLK